MLNPEFFLKSLINNGIEFYTGVPDSLLKFFLQYLDFKIHKDMHTITVNEGAAIALASGYQVATGKLPLVYMQNSGLGNAINPLVSLTSRSVYRIPMLLLIGWRGEPGMDDEPQHLKQGGITEDLLRLLEIDYFIVDGFVRDIDALIKEAVKRSNKTSSPFALLIKKDSFKSHNKPLSENLTIPHTVKRSDAVNEILNNIPSDALIVSTTGFVSRELYSQVKKRGRGLENIFMMIGSMGHCSQFALGISIGSPDKMVVCIDGDGSLLMHMGSMFTTATSNRKANLLHIVFNNGIHESVGGQRVSGSVNSYSKIATECGYECVYGPVTNIDMLGISIKKIMQNIGGVAFLEIKVSPSPGKNLPRPIESLRELKSLFQSQLL